MGRDRRALLQHAAYYVAPKAASPVSSASGCLTLRLMTLAPSVGRSLVDLPSISIPRRAMGLCHGLGLPLAAVGRPTVRRGVRLLSVFMGRTGAISSCALHPPMVEPLVAAGCPKISVSTAICTDQTLVKCTRRGRQVPVTAGSGTVQQHTGHRALRGYRHRLARP